jgi:hypothetical protein
LKHTVSSSSRSRLVPVPVVDTVTCSRCGYQAGFLYQRPPSDSPIG